MFLYFLFNSFSCKTNNRYSSEDEYDQSFYDTYPGYSYSDYLTPKCENLLLDTYTTTSSSAQAEDYELVEK